MSRATMAAALPGRSTIYGIGYYPVRGGQVEFEIGWPEYERDVAWATRVLGTWGVARSEHVLFLAQNWESPWGGPIVEAARNLGMINSNAEPYAWDAPRCASFLRRLRFTAFVGISTDTAMALVEQPEVVELLREVGLLWARPAALAPLRAAGLEPALFTVVGPALALECPARAGAHLDPDEWAVRKNVGGLVVETVGDRVHVAEGAVTELSGEIDTTPCTCGLPGPRIRLDPPT